MSKPSGIQRWIIVLGVVLTFGCALVFAQAQTGEILGLVTDSTGGSIPGASVTITQTDTGTVRAVTTDGQGRYEASNLNIGNYQVEAQMQGFAPQEQKGLVLAVGQNIVADFKLQVGTITQEVTVSSSAAPQVNTTTSEVAALVSENQLQELPLNGRDYMQLITLAPGVEPLESASSGPNSGNQTRFSVAGARVEAGSVLLDGLEIRSFWGDGAGLSIMNTSLGVESIAEFQTITSGFNAEYSGLSVINEVTRSGTNGLHGSAYGFFRNSAMDARNYFDGPTPAPFHRDQFGGSLGGPIKKNKAFFFVNYEGIRDALAVYDQQLVPNANAHLGILPCAALSGVAACAPPTASSTLVNIGVNPAVAPYLALYPNYGQPGGPPLPAGWADTGVGTLKFTTYYQQPQSEDYLATKLDYQLSAKNSLAVRFVRDHGLQTDPWTNGGNLVSPGIQVLAPSVESDPETNWYATIQDRHVFSASLINVASVGFVRTVQGTKLDFSKIPAIMKTFVPGLPLMGYVSISNVASLGSAYYDPLQWLVNTYSAQDEVDWIHGAHSFKFGVGVARLDCNCAQSLDPGANYNFGGIQGFLQDQPTLLTAPIPAQVAAFPGTSFANRYTRQTNLSVFVQDDWKVSRRLTLNLGLRDDYITNPVDATGVLYRITNLDPFTCSNNLACGTPEPGISGGPSDPTGWTKEPHFFKNNPSTRNIDPRVGLAWDIFGDGKTSFRAGYGIFHQLIYPRFYVPGDAFGYPQLEASITAFGGSTGTFPNAALTTLQPFLARNQAPWNMSVTPYVQEWNATIQRQVPWGMMVSLGYVGSESTHLTSEQDYNVNIPTAGTQFRPLNPTSKAGIACAPTCTAGFGVGAAGYTPNTTFGPIEQSTPNITSNYNSMVLTVQRSLGKGIQFQSSFTYSRCLDYGSATVAGFDGSNDASEWVYPYANPKLNYGPCAFNVSRNWSSNALIPLPFHGNQLKEGWQLAAISHVQTGNPVTPTLGSGFDQNNFGQYTYVTERPNLNPNFTGPLILGKQTQWYNPAAFVLQAPGQFGNAPRAIIQGPGLVDVDFTVMKSFKISKLGEASSVEIRSDFFNLFNHTNLALPSGGVFTGSIGNGKVSSTAGFIGATTTTARQLQFSARLVF